MPVEIARVNLEPGAANFTYLASDLARSGCTEQAVLQSHILLFSVEELKIWSTGGCDAS